ncbi:STM4015 family protein [Streptomyces spiramenti]|uniref:Leucine-rich repeat domain-containing protein n=1 Tax=Streptomyces spiramenti TaxID=2720606 RepID=A0ABX1AQQ6_9ACTN|nr:STM4015 family protein [Streptomyces spiramenti]NJP66782.1 leucine-rich repeat domain-containing protein [Streptomyces spiramenti]
MTDHGHADQPVDLPTEPYEGPGAATAVADHGAVAWHLSCDRGGREIPFADVFRSFCEHVRTEEVREVRIGTWDEIGSTGSEEVVALLCGAAERFPALRALYLGDIPWEQSEISWIVQSDVTPLLTSFPRLRRLVVRGSGVGLRPVLHEELRLLRIETGGLPGATARAVGACDLPSLRELELWMGEEEYGADSDVEDLAGILSGERLPELRHLGLQNSEYQDAIAAAVATAPVVPRLRTLDLSMGALGDAGATALLAGQSLAHLDSLDLSHHFMSDEVVGRVRRRMRSLEVEVDLDEQLEEEHDCEEGTEGGPDCDCVGYRYAAVGE